MRIEEGMRFELSNLGFSGEDIDGMTGVVIHWEDDGTKIVDIDLWTRHGVTASNVTLNFNPDISK